MPNHPEIYEDYRDQGVTTLFLLPSYQGDFCVTALEQSRVSYIAPAYAASLFLTHERGLPLQELEADTPKGKCYIEMLEKDGRYGVLVPKCKFLYAKTMNFDADVQIKVNYVSSMGRTFCIADVTDSKMVSDGVQCSPLKPIDISLSGDFVDLRSHGCICVRDMNCNGSTV